MGRMKIAENIKKFRTKRGWSQRVLADRAGFKHAIYIAHWERGRRVPSLPSLEKLAKALKVSITELTK